MPLPESIDFDKLSFAISQDLKEAITIWLNGMPTDEFSLMNHVTGRLSKRRLHCDVGAEDPTEVKCDLYELHRRGDANRDRYGADVAVTVDIPNDNFLKTAFFQFKVSSEMKVSLELEQLEQAYDNPEIGDRSFVFVVDKERRTMRLASSGLLLHVISLQRTKTMTFNCSEWASLNEWIHGWLSCDVGLPSDRDDPSPLSVENLLEHYKISAHREQGELIWEEAVLSQSPASVWLKYKIAPKVKQG